MIKQANWIKSAENQGDICPLFRKNFTLTKKVTEARLFISALGVYEAKMNDCRIGDFILAPGWTVYKNRVQYQEYNVSDLIKSENIFEITLGKGWCFGELTWENKVFSPFSCPAIICTLKITFDDGTNKVILSDESFETALSEILHSDIYDGEIYDSRFLKKEWKPAEICDYPKDILVPQQGEHVCEIEEIKPVNLLITKMNEKVLDFGQNLTGYIKFKTNAPKGTVLELSHGEVLGGAGLYDGCFYNENLRSAQQRIIYIANGEKCEYKPHFTFQGFRYVKLDKWPGDVNLDDFSAVVVHSNMKRTGYFECSNEKINKLFSNIVWGQKGNFLDVPTDCPQRDERLGWTGDAQVFVRTASYNYDVQKFFDKWLADLSLEQFADGSIPAVVPNVLGDGGAGSAAWGDAVVICPWQIYLTYGDEKLLGRQFDSMKKWVEYIRKQGDNEFLWNTGNHYADWLGLDAEDGSYVGATPKELIATAYFAYSASLLIKAGKVLNKDMSSYESLHKNIVSAFQDEYIKDGKITHKTQTAHAIALYFDLCGESRESIAKDLADLVTANGNKLTTGFVGTPYLLHALSQNGYNEIAYSLLLQEDFPSWLYSVNKGATTIWEHWDGLKDDGSFWSTDMNSFNHYAYGAVADWMYGVAAGINTDINAPGFENAILKPIYDKRLEYAAASIDTKFGKLSSKWSKHDSKIVYEFEVPNKATVIIGKNKYEVGRGKHVFEGE